MSPGLCLGNSSALATTEGTSPLLPTTGAGVSGDGRGSGHPLPMDIGDHPVSVVAPGPSFLAFYLWI